MVRPTPTFWTSGGIFRCTLGPRSGTTYGDNNRGATGTDVVSWTTRKKEEGQKRWLKVRLSDSRTKALASSRRAMAKTSFFTCLLATAAVSTSYTKDSPCLSRLDKVLKAHVRRAFASSKWKRQRPQRRRRLETARWQPFPGVRHAAHPAAVEAAAAEAAGEAGGGGGPVGLAALDCSMSASYNRPMFSSQYPFACVRKCTVTDFAWCG